jgi:hypothetical protein
MTKREAEIVRKLIQCYKDCKDERLLDVIELLAEEKPDEYSIPPLFFFNSEGDCVASTDRMSHTASPDVLSDNAEDTTTDSTLTNLESRARPDSSGAVTYCGDDDDDDETKKTNDETND